MTLDQAILSPAAAKMTLSLASLSPSAAIFAAIALVVVLSVAVFFFPAFLKRQKTDEVSNNKFATQEKGQAVDGVPAATIKILYGTQTGTAERFSKQLMGEIKRKYSPNVPVVPMDLEYYPDAKQLQHEKFIIFCVATYGDGEPTDNAAAFYNALVKWASDVENGEESPALQGLHYAVFGLGNKQYEHFNSVGKAIHKSLKTLGATPAVRLGLGDDDSCIDDDFDKWSVDLYTNIDANVQMLGAKSKSMDLGNGAVPGKYEVLEYDVEILANGEASQIHQALPFSAGDGSSIHHLYWAKLAVVRSLFAPNSDRACVHVEIDVTGSKIKYEHGDHIAVYCENSPAVVEEVAGLLELPLDTVFKISKPKDSEKSANLSEPFSSPINLRTALAYMADVLSSPHKESLLQLAAFASDPNEAKRLQLLASPEGKAEYTEYIAKCHRSLLEVLREHPSVKVPLGAFFGGVAPRLQPRFYSISSSPKAHPDSVHVTCAVVREQMPTGRLHEGIASTFFERSASQIGRTLPVFVRHSHFKLPTNAMKPIIMIGPGTGLAPFRGFLQEREAMMASGIKLGAAHLFYGCRHREQDYLYKEELEAFVSSGVLSQLHVAFSRESQAKDYVTHHLSRNGSQLWPLLDEQGGYIYVCGDAKHMARDVQQVLVQMVSSSKPCTAGEAETYLKELTAAGRYQRDVW